MDLFRAYTNDAMTLLANWDAVHTTRLREPPLPNRDRPASPEERRRAKREQVIAESSVRDRVQKQGLKHAGFSPLLLSKFRRVIDIDQFVEIFWRRLSIPSPINLARNLTTDAVRAGDSPSGQHHQKKERAQVPSHSFVGLAIRYSQHQSHAMRARIASQLLLQSIPIP